LASLQSPLPQRSTTVHSGVWHRHRWIGRLGSWLRSRTCEPIGLLSFQSWCLNSKQMTRMDNMNIYLEYTLSFNDFSSISWRLMNRTHSCSISSHLFQHVCGDRRIMHVASNSAATQQTEQWQGESIACQLHWLHCNISALDSSYAVCTLFICSYLYLSICSMCVLCMYIWLYYIFIIFILIYIYIIIIISKYMHVSMYAVHFCV
jgi:hypothetical protein